MVEPGQGQESVGLGLCGRSHGRTRMYRGIDMVDGVRKWAWPSCTWGMAWTGVVGRARKRTSVAGALEEWGSGHGQSGHGHGWGTGQDCELARALTHLL